MHLSTDQIENIKKFLISKWIPYYLWFNSPGRMNLTVTLTWLFKSSSGCISYDLYMLAQEMAGIVGRDIHLMKQQASTVCKQVVSRGTVILDLEPQKAGVFILTLKQYAT